MPSVAPGGGDAALRRGDGSGGRESGEQIGCASQNSLFYLCSGWIRLVRVLLPSPFAPFRVWTDCRACGGQIVAAGSVSANLSSGGSSSFVPSFDGVLELTKPGGVFWDEHAALTLRALLDKLGRTAEMAKVSRVSF